MTVIEDKIAVQPVDGKAVALVLGLGHTGIQKDPGIFIAYGIAVIILRKVADEILIDLILIADKPAFDGNADQIRQMSNCLFPCPIVKIEAVADELFLQALLFLDPAVIGDNPLAILFTQLLNCCSDLPHGIFIAAHVQVIVFYGVLYKGKQF